MKKFIVVLALLIATPAFALTVDCNDLGGGVVAIQYSGADVNNLPAAFGLSITASAGTLTLDSGSYKTGESTNADPGYGIFPGSINLANPAVPVWNTPVADPCDEPAGDADGTDFVVIELGALYDEDTNAPLTSGTLCTFTASVTPCTVTLQDEATYRGGVVLEDGNTVTVDSNCTLAAGSNPCDGKIFPGCNPTGPNTAEYDQWVLVGEPACWAHPRQCDGDADGRAEGKGSTWVSLDDLTVLKAAWNKDFPTIDGQTTTVTGLAVEWICADFDHAPEGKGNVRAALEDLTILKANWNIPGGPDPNCGI